MAYWVGLLKKDLTAKKTQESNLGPWSVRGLLSKKYRVWFWSEVYEKYEGRQE